VPLGLVQGRAHSEGCLALGRFFLFFFFLALFPFFPLFALKLVQRFLAGQRQFRRRFLIGAAGAVLEPA